MTKIQHLAIILDGNRTWAREKKMPEFLGHTQGAKNIKRIVQASIEEGIQFLTLYTLSTENLKKRSEAELKHLFSLFEKITDYKSLFEENNVQFKVIGDPKKLPEQLQTKLEELIKFTSENTGLKLSFAINYGGRDELIRAIKKIENTEDLNEENFSNHLDTAGYPDVDLLIRTGGYQRLSNFLPWQSTYAELYFTPLRWPAFSPDDLKEAIVWFSEQKRKKGV